jgi:hypothetical protein
MPLSVSVPAKTQLEILVQLRGGERRAIVQAKAAEVLARVMP